MKAEVEKTARILGEQMKNGYVSHLILLVLKKNPSHGYKIVQEIEKRSFGMWNPSTSTIYRVLESLERKNLIKVLKEEEEGRQKRIYEITAEGEKTLEILIETYEKMQEAMKRMIISSITLTDDLDTDEFKDFIPLKGPLIMMNEVEDINENIRALEIRKSMIEKKIDELEVGLRNIDIEIERLKNRAKNK